MIREVFIDLLSIALLWGKLFLLRIHLHSVAGTLIAMLMQTWIGTSLGTDEEASVCTFDQLTVTFSVWILCRISIIPA